MYAPAPLTRTARHAEGPVPFPNGGPDADSSTEFVRSASIREHGRDWVELDARLTDGSTLVARLAVAGDGVIRVVLREPGELPPVRRFARPADTEGDLTVTHDGEHVSLGDGRLRADIALDPFSIVFRDSRGRVILGQNNSECDVSGALAVLPFGRTTVDGETVAWHDCFDAAPDEHFVGGGEKFGSLDKRGQRLRLWHYDAHGVSGERAYKNVPLIVSSRGYGLFVDTPGLVDLDLAASNHATSSVVLDDAFLDYYVLAGPAPSDVLRRYAALVGNATLPPKWAFGLWISGGFTADSDAAVRERAARVRREGIPADVLHIDCYWQRFGRWSDLMWDDSAFPDPEGLFGDLHSDGWHVSLWINPYIGTSSPVFDEAAASKHFLAHPDGGPYVCKTWAGDHHPVTGILDFTNPDVRGWYAEKLRALLRQGADVFKTDFGEGVPADAIAHDGSTGRSLHNPYPLLYNDVVSDVTAEVHGHRLVWGRSTWSGGQRHAAQWGGDPNSTWADMAATLRGGLSFAMSGHAFWSHDIGGFHGTPDPELYIRWAQFGLLSPLSRMHGMSSRLPWEFGEEALSVVRDFARLRYSLLPYIYSASITSVQTGCPVMRPLLVDHAEDPACWTADLEYLLGPDLLVAPIFAPGGEREVYLPRGRWVDFYSGDVSEGGRWIHIRTPLEQCPLWVREGAVLPRMRVPESIVDQPWAALDLQGYLPPDGVGTAAAEIFDVGGRTRHVRAEYDRERLSLAVSGVRRGDRFVFRHANGRRPPVEMNGQPVPVEETTLDERGDLIVVLGAVEPGPVPPRSGTST